MPAWLFSLILCLLPLAAGMAPASESALGIAVGGAGSGDAHTCAVTALGGALCWGNNQYGQLGNGTNTSSGIPVGVAGLSSGVARIATGEWHSCALTAGGGVLCWGNNDYGQLGDGTTADRSVPVGVVGLSSGVTAIAAGSWGTCALTSAAGALCWGLGFDGQIGDGTKFNRNLATGVTGLSSGVAAIAASGFHACAVTTTGGVLCWGNNDYGTLGNGTGVDSSIPLPVAGLSSGVAVIAAGHFHTCALKTNGAVVCWGSNALGRLGDGTGIDSSSPVGVAGLSSGVSMIAAGDSHTCAVTGGGAVLCWGLVNFGPLGSGTVSGAPLVVPGLSSGIARVAAGYSHSCATTYGGGAVCWGNNADGQLGDGRTASSSVPLAISGLSTGVSKLAAGYSQTCAVTASGGVVCWGNAYGSAPSPVPGLASGVAALAAGAWHTCALTTGGGVLCWGSNLSGQLGDGTPSAERTTPVPVTGLSSGVASIAAGAQHTCAATTGGAAVCWGSNYHGNLGDGTRTDRAVPAAVAGLSSGVSAISAGDSHTCAVIGGGVRCWGLNGSGQLGDGTTATRTSPVVVTGLPGGNTRLATGAAHTCAGSDTGSVWCWGLNNEGQLGDGTTATRSVPVSVAGLASGVASLAAGLWHSCALTGTGGLRCWGSNDSGQLGDGTTQDRGVPTSVVGLSSGIGAVSGGVHTCALTTGGVPQCWGSNLHGQLGDARSPQSHVPVPVLGFQLDDPDGDGFAIGPDNCPELANANQSDLDLDARGDACDNCPAWPNLDQGDSDQNGIGNACECGDQTQDAVVNVLDLIAINLAIFNPAQASPLCDTNYDGLCNVLDILGARNKIFGTPAYCSRQPPPGL